ncbi:MAG: radical SAM protein [Dehalococcoidia bacterium]|nr:radical SAM protein [Dehalococcoidia bacterium]
MTVTEAEAKSVLRRHRKIDSWFVSRYGMNLYRGCFHNCIYCDGRAEGYYVSGEFGEDVLVKVNAIDVLRRELDAKRRRKPLPRSYIMLGGGVGDSYQPIEKKYELTRRALQLVHDSGFPVHVLTKSTLVTRDADILKAVNQRGRAIVSFSFSSVDDRISDIVEPRVPPPSERLEAIRFFKGEGLACGMFLLPVIPGVTDSAELLEEAVAKASGVGVDFIIFGGMTLKEGRQRTYFEEKIKDHYPRLTVDYRHIYRGSKWGEPAYEYADSLNRSFGAIARRYNMPIRMPPALYQDILGGNDLVVVILEHIDYLLRKRGERSTFGRAAYSISQVPEYLWEMKGDLRKVRGVDETVECVVLEILDMGKSSYYEQLLSGDT